MVHPLLEPPEHFHDPVWKKGPRLAGPFSFHIDATRFNGFALEHVAFIRIRASCSNFLAGANSCRLIGANQTERALSKNCGLLKRLRQILTQRICCFKVTFFGTHQLHNVIWQFWQAL